MVKIPEEYQSLENQHARIVILLDAAPEVSEVSEVSEVRALSDHSAGLVDDWRDPAEDAVFPITEFESQTKRSVYQGPPLTLQQMRDAIDWEAGQRS
ncbi:hypothetical protein Thi970DRAFT_00217 [Thiorhodovibrio frisius]|uniref:Uncharacterized protein n=2 Tax=Thiorhodovibrio frisius TaxID=631362 RepID=H8YWB4_9GAMM|nr:hypothetical protein Thi970DRAFT_00217 [Thiorhodovibrio frisius]WPL20107.1 hypothetical protein Thiofri_00163 [Thiorhodovibrio frisius]